MLLQSIRGSLYEDINGNPTRIEAGDFFEVGDERAKKLLSVRPEIVRQATVAVCREAIAKAAKTGRAVSPLALKVAGSAAPAPTPAAKPTAKAAAPAAEPPKAGTEEVDEG
jgi:hypothetical protein